MSINHTVSLYAFALGREWKLSLAELFAVFGNDAYRQHSEQVAVFEIDENDDYLIAKFRNIGGSVRLMRVIGETDEARFPTDAISEIVNRKSGTKDTQIQDTNTPTYQPSKVTFALGAYGLEYRLSDIGLRIKKTLQERGLSVRLVNTENKNINAATFKKEKLGKTQSEYNIIQIPAIARNEVHQKTPLPPFSGGLTPNELTSQHSNPPTSKPSNLQTYYLSRTLACQDIDAYSRRDTGKSRDMVVGMMPPKLVQMMINLAILGEASGKLDNQFSGALENLKTGKLSTTIYDPFCGLGTTLIEAANMGITNVIGSDISPDMVRATQESLEAFIAEEKVWQDRIKKVGGIPNKDFSKFQSEIFELDAGNIARLAEKLETGNSKLETMAIVTEGYLGEMMQKDSITTDRVKIERAKLARMYNGFFGGLRTLGFTGSIVISFPFWDIRGTLSYFTEIYDVLDSHGFRTVPLLPSELNLMTQKGTLLYKRPGQNVGREIIKIEYKQ